MEPARCRLRLGLSYKSRVNFGKVHTVEHHNKVMPVGQVSQRSIGLLLKYFNEAQMGLLEGTDSVAARDFRSRDEFLPPSGLDPRLARF